MNKKIILVTGGNRGIGFETCRQLAKLGHTVIMGSRNFVNGEKAAKSIPLEITIQPLDVTDEDSIKTGFDFIKTDYGKLDVLINNAGIGIGSAGAIDALLENVKQIMETNFYGAWRMCQVFAPLLRKSKEGRIVNMSSGMGELNSLSAGGYAGYRLSKTSLNALTIMLSHELENDNIKVNAMCPGWVKTDMGGAGAPRTVSKGADTAVWLATEDKIPNGMFFRDRKPINW